jgi:hypothetical protein
MALLRLLEFLFALLIPGKEQSDVCVGDPSLAVKF